MNSSAISTRTCAHCPATRRGRSRGSSSSISATVRSCSLTSARRSSLRAEATSGDPADPAAQAARAEATGRAREALDGPLAGQRLDAIVTLTANPAGLTDYVLGDNEVFHTSRPSAVAGYPAISVPAGQVRGLPVGLSFLGPAWSEPALIGLAYAFEQASQALSWPSLQGTLTSAVGRSDSLRSWIPGVA